MSYTRRIRIFKRHKTITLLRSPPPVPLQPPHLHLPPSPMSSETSTPLYGFIPPHAHAQPQAQPQAPIATTQDTLLRLLEQATTELSKTRGDLDRTRKELDKTKQELFDSKTVHIRLLTEFKAVIDKCDDTSPEEKSNWHKELDKILNRI